MCLSFAFDCDSKIEGEKLNEKILVGLVIALAVLSIVLFVRNLPPQSQEVIQLTDYSVKQIANGEFEIDVTNHEPMTLYNLTFFLYCRFLYEYSHSIFLWSNDYTLDPNQTFKQPYEDANLINVTVLRIEGFAKPIQ